MHEHVYNHVSSIGGGDGVWGGGGEEFAEHVLEKGHYPTLQP